MRPKYLFLDLETTGLDPTRDVVLEYAAVPLDADLERANATAYEIQRFSKFGWGPISSVVVDMHTRNGLWAACESAEPVMFWSKLAVLIESHDWAEGKPILAGSSIHFDRSFLPPQIVARLHHRMLDVSSIKMLCQDMAPDGTAWPKGEPKHRATSDVLGSIATLRALRRTLKWTAE